MLWVLALIASQPEVDSTRRSSENLTYPSNVPLVQSLVVENDVVPVQLSEVPEGAIWQYVLNGEENMEEFMKQDKTPAARLPPVDPLLTAMYRRPNRSTILFIRRWQLWRDQYLDRLYQSMIKQKCHADFHQEGPSVSTDTELKWPMRLPNKPGYYDLKEWKIMQKRSSWLYCMVNDDTKIADLPKLHRDSIFYRRVRSPARKMWFRRRLLWKCERSGLPRDHFSGPKVSNEPGLLSKVYDLVKQLLDEYTSDKKQAKPKESAAGSIRDVAPSDYPLGYRILELSSPKRVDTTISKDQIN